MNSVSLYVARPQVLDNHTHTLQASRQKMLAFFRRGFKHYCDCSGEKNSLPSKSFLCLLLRLLYRLYVKQTSSIQTAKTRHVNLQAVLPNKFPMVIKTITCILDFSVRIPPLSCCSSILEDEFLGSKVTLTFCIPLD